MLTMTYKRQSSISNSATELHNYDLIDGIVVRIGEQYKPPPRISAESQRLSTAVPAEELLAFEYDFRVEKDFLDVYKARWETRIASANVTNKAEANIDDSEVSTEVNGDDELEQLRRWQEQSARVETDELDSARSWHLTDMESTTPKSRYMAQNAGPPPQLPPPPAIPFPFNTNTTTLLIPEKNPSPVNFNTSPTGFKSTSDHAANKNENDKSAFDSGRFSSKREASPQQGRKPSLRLEDFEPSANPFDSMELTSIDDRKELESILSSSSSSSVTTTQQQTPTMNSMSAVTHRR